MTRFHYLFDELSSRDLVIFHYHSNLEKPFEYIFVVFSATYIDKRRNPSSTENRLLPMDIEEETEEKELKFLLVPSLSLGHKFPLQVLGSF